jgi:hypothetical protein
MFMRQVSQNESMSDRHMMADNGYFSKCIALVRSEFDAEQESGTPLRVMPKNDDEVSIPRGEHIRNGGFDADLHSE